MPEQNDSKPSSDQPLVSRLKRGLGPLVELLTALFSLIRFKTEGTRHQLKEILYSTSDQVLEKAEETRKSVKLRMAILEIEHHLNRLYPQIGKITCDLAAASDADWLGNGDLKAKVELAGEYRQRLADLREELAVHQHRQKPSGA